MELCHSAGWGESTAKQNFSLYCIVILLLLWRQSMISPLGPPRPGDRVQVIDDSNEDWWKGKSQDKVGFFPANFVQRVRPGEQVWKVTQSFHGNREKGQMTVKELQICVGKSEETDGFFKLTSGKKRGLVPSKCVVEI
ncbi:hypothetical protein PDJAM_G00032770 [Pangasius djambal]|uniref:Uncharacterized protein n=1 Tax=Pangasius djambal TaxID=1691987 RepID=A0ACC5YR36_9TELE|nr:hypothetical protein [Pangasius djambal]